MKLLSYNVNGIRAALKKGFASWLEATQADIICIQETKAMESQVDTTILEEIGYHHFWFSAQKKAIVELQFFQRRNQKKSLMEVG